MVPEEVGEEGFSLSLLARAGGEVCMAQPLTLRRGEVGKESLGGERSARTHRLSCSNQGAGGRESSFIRTWYYAPTPSLVQFYPHHPQEAKGETKYSLES